MMFQELTSLRNNQVLKLAISTHYSASNLVEDLSILLFEYYQTMFSGISGFRTLTIAYSCVGLLPNMYFLFIKKTQKQSYEKYGRREFQEFPKAPIFHSQILKLSICWEFGNLSPGGTG